MKVMAFNGGPRKQWNTAMMLEKALAGAASQGAATSLTHLYDLTYKGCISCFACKKRGGKSYGRCAVKDDLTPVFAEIRETDALILGSPIYFGDVSGEMRSFMERLLFPFLVYARPGRSLYPKKIPVGLIYTGNVPEEMINAVGYDRLFAGNERTMEMIFGGPAKTISSHETLQFEDYSKVVADMFDVEKKQKRRQEVFPRDLQKAFDLGAGMISH